MKAGWFWVWVLQMLCAVQKSLHWHEANQPKSTQSMETHHLWRCQPSPPHAQGCQGWPCVLSSRSTWGQLSSARAPSPGAGWAISISHTQILWAAQNSAAGLGCEQDPSPPQGLAALGWAGAAEPHPCRDFGSPGTHGGWCRAPSAGQAQGQLRSSSVKLSSAGLSSLGWLQGRAQLMTAAVRGAQPEGRDLAFVKTPRQS